MLEIKISAAVIAHQDKQELEREQSRENKGEIKREMI